MTSLLNEKHWHQSFVSIFIYHELKERDSHTKEKKEESMKKKGRLSAHTLDISCQAHNNFTLDEEATKKIAILSRSSSGAEFVAKLHRRSNSTMTTTVTAAATQEQLRRITSSNFSKSNESSNHHRLCQVANFTHKCGFLPSYPEYKAKTLQSMETIFQDSRKKTLKMRWLSSQEAMNENSEKNLNMSRLYLQNLFGLPSINTNEDAPNEEKPNRRPVAKFKEELFNNNNELMFPKNDKNIRIAYELFHPRKPVKEINPKASATSQTMTDLREKTVFSPKKGIRQKPARFFESNQIMISRSTKGPYSPEKSTFDLCYEATTKIRPSTTTFQNRVGKNLNSDSEFKVHPPNFNPQSPTIMRQITLKEKSPVDDQVKPRIFRKFQNKTCKNLPQEKTDNSLLKSKHLDPKNFADWLEQLDQDEILKLSKKNIEKSFNPLFRKTSKIYDENLEKHLDKTGNSLKKPLSIATRKTFKDIRMSLAAALNNLARLKLQISEVNLIAGS